ncbi:hypothetical protein NP493_8g06014 [Ridgeia piscesae]|uniref:Uronyl 2-sulfotransferase n=1 Tax=Ridgeia piscesae TaxID=27915 RepID=A0AAD9PFG6_RIDPI|nr:hypothetical protein NP493_8g06014 [Ridgeia piscesae]
MEMPTYMNIIRDPFERMVSFYYFRRFQAKLIEPLPDVDKNRSFDTCVLENYPECTEPYGDTHGFGYFQLIPFFCGHAAFCRKPTLNALETAIANVERYYSIIGVVEQFDQFLEALEVVFPDYFRGVTHIYKTAGKYKRKVNASIHKVKPTAKVRQIMREKLYLEYKFYYFVKWRFDKLYREIVSNRSTDVPSSDTYFN